MTRKSGPKRERTPLEMIVLGLSLIGIVSIVGGLIWYGLTADGSKPQISTEIAPTNDSSGPNQVYEVTAKNEGNVTAEELVVEVVSGETTIEIEFKAVAKGDEEKAMVALPIDSQAPTTRIVTYRVP